MKRPLLFLSLALNLFFIGKILLNRMKSEAHPKPDRQQYLTESRIATAKFAEMPKSDSAIIFLGTSLTAGFNWSEYFQSCLIKNRGISGNTSAEMRNRINQEKGSVCFIEAGLNDIIFGISSDSLVKNIAYIAGHFHNSFVTSILPTAGKYAYLNDSVNRYNDVLRSYCKARGIPYIDTHDKFLESGQMNPLYTIDGTHLNAAGYKQWAEILRSYLSSML